MKQKSIDSPRNKYKSHSSNNLFFLLLLSTNLITLFISSSFSSCSLKPLSTTTASTIEETATKASDLPPEFLAFTSGQALLFGFNTNFDSYTIYLPAGKACTLFPGELLHYMSYKVWFMSLGRALSPKAPPQGMRALTSARVPPCLSTGIHRTLPSPRQPMDHPVRLFGCVDSLHVQELQLARQQKTKRERLLRLQRLL